MINAVYILRAVWFTNSWQVKQDLIHKFQTNMDCVKVELKEEMEEETNSLETIALPTSPVVRRPTGKVSHAVSILFV